MDVRRASRNLLKGHVGKAALALIQGVSRSGFFLIDIQGKLKVASLLFLAPLQQHWIHERRMQLPIQLHASSIFQPRYKHSVCATLPHDKRMFFAVLFAFKRRQNAVECGPPRSP
jgi:hypothetical protein